MGDGLNQFKRRLALDNAGTGESKGAAAAGPRVKGGVPLAGTP
jgi:hypothetical protein